MSDLNSFGKMVSALFFVAFPALYLLPTYEASRRKHADIGAIALVNIFLGWSLIGWVVALAWAFKQAPTVAVTVTSAPAPTPASRPVTELASDLIDKRLCPFCAEEIKKTAIRCKHCHADLTEAKPVDAGAPT